MKKIEKSERIFQKTLTAMLLGALVSAGCTSNDPESDNTLPSFSEETPLTIGAILCSTGPQAAKAATIERAVLLAQDFINGSTRAYPGVNPGDIPCRKAKNCGVWAGRDKNKRDLRARLEIVIADGEGRPVRAANAAKDLRSRFSVPLIIGPCSTEETAEVFKEVTKTETMLITPVATGDSITDIDDRTATEKKNNRPGWVYRMITPDYIQMQVLGQAATNLEDPPILIRHDDEIANEDCTKERDGDAFCAKKHPKGYRCLASARTDNPPFEFYEYEKQECNPSDADEEVKGGGKAAFKMEVCDNLGKNYLCTPRESGSGSVCARFRYKKHCTKVVKPITAMALYAKPASGKNSLFEEIKQYWVDRKENFMIASKSYDPADLASFSKVVGDLLTEGSAEFKKLQTDGAVASGFKFEDSVIFLLSSETEASLLLQEWQTQLPKLPAGSDRVFWLGTDRLRSRSFLDSVSAEAIRNLYVADPYTTDLNDFPIFEEMFTSRWKIPPGGYAANIFDTVLLLVLAHERVGQLQAAKASGAVDRKISPATLKNNLAVVSVGCARNNLDPCPADAQFDTFGVDDFSEAMTTLAKQGNIRFHGTSGNLSLSVEGDRIGDFNIWKVQELDEGKQFFTVGVFPPAANGITLRK